MIEVIINLIPYGQEKYKRTLSTITIGNMQTKDGLADYTYKVQSTENVEIVSGEIKDFPREKLTAHDLVLCVLQDILENK